MTNAEKCKRYRERNPASVESKAAAKLLGRMKKERENARFMMRARLARHDAKYAASPCAAPVTVEERDLRNSELGQIVRIETRGRVPCGSFSPRFVGRN